VRKRLLRPASISTEQAAQIALCGIMPPSHRNRTFSALLVERKKGYLISILFKADNVFHQFCHLFYATVGFTICGDRVIVRLNAKIVPDLNIGLLLVRFNRRSITPGGAYQ
jgi:hypothetical protein